MQNLNLPHVASIDIFSAPIKIKKGGFVYACFAEDPLCDPGSMQRRVLLFIPLDESSPILLVHVNCECNVFVRVLR